MKLTANQLRKIIKEEIESTKNNHLNEAMSRITPDEIAAWKNGDWAFVSGQDSHLPNAEDDQNRFLHGKKQDDEGSMVKSRLYSMNQMAKDVCDLLQPSDQLPGWVQDHISVAHENLQQVHGYLMGKQHSLEHPASEKIEESSKTKEDLFEGTFDLKEYLKG